MRTATYCRTSTDRQDGDGQRHALAIAVEARGWAPVDEYVDLDQSGTKASRPAWDKLLREVRAGRVRRVVVPSLSRCGRRALTVLVLVEEFKRLGCELVSLSENLDTSTPIGQCLVTVLCALAQLERDTTAERIRATYQARKAHGPRKGKGAWGRPRKPAVAAALADVREGMPVATAARRHGVTPGAVRAARERA